MWWSTPSEDHIRHCILFCLHAGLNATITTKKISDIYEYVIKVKKCQQRLECLLLANWDLSDRLRRERSLTKFLINNTTTHTYMNSERYKGNEYMDCTNYLRFRRKLFLNRNVNGDEKLILHDNIERSKQWLCSNQTAKSALKSSLSKRHLNSYFSSRTLSQLSLIMMRINI